MAFRLGAMINYEFSNLPHNGVTPSNPIKKNHQDCFLSFFFSGKYIFFRYFLSFSLLFTEKGICGVFFFPLQRRKTSLRLALAAFPSDGGIPCVRGDSGPLPMALGPLVGHPQPPAAEASSPPCHFGVAGTQGRLEVWGVGWWQPARAEREKGLRCVLAFQVFLPQIRYHSSASSLRLKHNRLQQNQNKSQ